MNQIVLLPVFVQIALTFVLLFWMGGARYRAVKSRAVRVKDIALGQDAWPPAITQIDRAFHNQLEMPLLFFALVALVIATGARSTLFVGLEWAFVLLRLGHAYVHVTSNVLTLRFGLFVAGVLALIAMWIDFAARLYSAS
jgi:hypothetical protein